MISNLIIISCALVCFFVFTIYYTNNQAIENLEMQLRNENLIHSHPIERPNHDNVPNNPQNNVQNRIGMTSNIIYRPIDSTIEILYSNFYYEDFVQDDRFIEQLYDLRLGKAEILRINGEKYYAVASRFIENDQLDNGFMIVSLRPYNEVSIITMENIVVFVLLLGVLLSTSFMLIRWQSRKITIPIEKLSNVAKQYANRDFSSSIEINSNDEIEELSNSIKEMVDSLINYERSQVSLFRTLSHELKTPLTAISGYAEGIENGYYKDISQPLSVIQEESTRIKDILEDLIFLSKMNSKSEQYNFEKTELVEVLTSAVRKIESIAILNDIDLYYEPCTPIYIKVDKTKILRVFINILSNALKYTTDFVEISICKNKEIVEIVVSDNGQGFNELALHNLRENKTIEAIDGNGLGLIIVKEIVKQHSGAFEVGNNDNGGAYVKIQI